MCGYRFTLTPGISRLHDKHFLNYVIAVIDDANQHIENIINSFCSIDAKHQLPILVIDAFRPTPKNSIVAFRRCFKNKLTTS